MANCYVCGIQIQPSERQFRRRVRTGGFERRRYGRGRVEVSQAHYGQRVVCKDCARHIDLQERRLWIEGHAKVLVALIVLLVALWIAQH